jgi:NADP-dependent 3-hydroxy acid dehydrogenase YdfG
LKINRLATLPFMTLAKTFFLTTTFRQTLKEAFAGTTNGRLRVVQLDVTNESEWQTVIKTIQAECPGTDVMVSRESSSLI